MSLYYRSSEHSITVMGQTYPHKEKIKKLGGTFVPGRKVWRIPFSDSSLQEVQTLCGTVGGGAVAGESSENSIALVRPEVPVASVTEPKSKGISIEQLYTKVELVLQQNFSRSFWLIGEVESVANRSSAVYITLVEKNGRGTDLSVNAVIWKSQLQELTAKYGKDVLKDLLQEGLKLCVSCQLNFYKGRGQISLQVKDLDPSYTKGALALEKEKTIKKLKSLGLYDNNRKKALSRFPFRIGLITAEGSRAYSDFCHQLEQKNFGLQVLFVSASMQGQTVTASVQNAFTVLREQKCDVIVITRGGGSASDLRCFDAFEVAKLVAESDVPVLAAIGHHDDSCVTEEVCYQHLKTPTAAAEFILRHFEQGLLYLDHLAAQMTKVMETHVDKLWQKQHQYCLQVNEALQSVCSKADLFLAQKESLLQRALQRNVVGAEKLCSSLETKLNQSFTHKLYKQSQDVSKLEAKLEQSSSKKIMDLSLKLQSFFTELKALDPRPWLKLGWTRLYSGQGELVKSIKDLKSGDKIEAQLLDGRVHMDITKTQENNIEGK